VPVAGGVLRVARWGDGPVVLGIHGITASSMSLAPVARHLPEHRLLAPDLRGRGASNALPGPFGMAAHAADCAAVIEHAGGGPAVVIGESMGGFVAAVLAATRPELVERVILVDGGLVPHVAPQVDDVDATMEAVLGPAIARLSQIFPSQEPYLDFWRAHPAVSEEWNDDVEAYLAYDLEPADGGFRSRVSAAAVRADSEDTLVRTSSIADALERLSCPVHLLRAPRNLLNQPTPLISDDLVEEWRAVLTSEEMVADTNHYTIVLGERGAKTIAERVVSG